MNRNKFRYVVTQEGNYRHGLAGVYAYLEVAKEQARRACIADRDDYHAWAVLAVPYNTPYSPPVKDASGIPDPVERGLEREVGRWTRTDTRRTVDDPRVPGGKRYAGRTPGEPVWTDTPVG